VRALLFASLCLLACTKPTSAPPPPAAPPPVEDCTLETKLVPGVPGSPGNLISSDINPNGASELAALMRTFVADWKDARARLQADPKATFAPRLPVHRKMRCAWPTSLDDRTAQYDAFAVGYLEKVKAFDTKPSRETYEGVLDGCQACHEVTCGGPLEVIAGMRWTPAN
jgi:hypothetical protein